MSHEDKLVLDTFLAYATKGDYEKALSYFAEDCTIIEADGMPHSGTYVGAQGFADAMKKMSAVAVPEITEVTTHDAGEFVVARMSVTFTSVTNDRQISMPVTELYWLEKGKIQLVDAYYKNPRAFDEIVD
jgi:ketosteroid isomerase-like protein